jgi:Lrp/AsnC family leucine-responsive transcriptional regulator
MKGKIGRYATRVSADFFAPFGHPFAEQSSPKSPRNPVFFAIIPKTAKHLDLFPQISTMTIQTNLDETDRTILEILQENGRTSNVELARRVNLSPPATHARVRRLEESGLIEGYSARLNREKAGWDMVCFISVSLRLHQWEEVRHFRTDITAIPEVLECHHVTGEFDYLLKVIFPNRKELERFVVQKLTPMAGIARIHTSLVIAEVKSSHGIPLPPPDTEQGGPA